MEDADVLWIDLSEFDALLVEALHELFCDNCAKLFEQCECAEYWNELQNYQNEVYHEQE